MGVDATRPYRALGYGERAVRRACPACGDRHAALIDGRTWTLQCRRCAWVFVRPFLFGTLERRVRGGTEAPPLHLIAETDPDVSVESWTT